MDLLTDLDSLVALTPAKTYLTVALTLLAAILLDRILRSYVRVPKSLDNKRSQTYLTIFRNIITIVVYVIAAQILFALLKIDITPLLASAGIVGIVLGIGARAIIEDLLTGLFLLTQEKIAIGDYVKIDDTEGYIESIEFRTLTIRSENGAQHIIPNGNVKKLINFSRHRAYVIVDIPVRTDQKIDMIIKAAEEALGKIQDDKEVGASLFPGAKIDGINEFKDATPIMIFRVTLITQSDMRWEVARKYRYYMKKACEKHTVTIG
jgi:small-conductance mechanosensitive channel